MKKPLLALAFFATAATVAVTPFSPSRPQFATAQGPVTPTSAFSRDLMKLADAAAWRTGIGAGTPYSLPIAAANSLGGVRVGTNLSIDVSGVLSAAGYTLPTASAGTLGGIRIGSGLSIDGSGVVTASGGGSSGWKAADGTSDPVYGQTIKTTGSSIMSSIQQPVASWVGGTYFESVGIQADAARLPGGVQFSELMHKVTFAPAEPTPLNYIHHRGFNVPGSAYFNTASFTLDENWEGCWAPNAGATSTLPGVTEFYFRFRKAGTAETVTSMRFNGWNMDNATGYVYDTLFTSNRFDFVDQGPLVHTNPSFDPSTRRNVYNCSFAGAQWGTWAALNNSSPGFVQFNTSSVNGTNANNQLDLFGNRVQLRHQLDSAFGPYYIVSETGHEVSGGVWTTSAGMQISASANAYNVAGMIFAGGRSVPHIEARNADSTSQFRIRGDASLEMASLNPASAAANAMAVNSVDSRLYYKDASNNVTYLSGPNSTTPAQITSTRNDYNPGIGAFQRWSSDGLRTVTGLVAGTNGERREVWNVGSQNIVLANDSASSMEANRFLNSTGESIVVLPNECVLLVYDGTTQRWRASPVDQNKGVPQNIRSADYTIAGTDNGKHIYRPSSDTTARTWTIPSNASVPLPVGFSFTVINRGASGNITLAITSDTLRLGGTGDTGSRTIAPFGIATVIKVTDTEWLITGAGVN